MADQCWPVHTARIAQAKPRMIITMGDKAGTYLARRLDAGLVDALQESNTRSYRHKLYRAADGRPIAALLHPARFA